MSNQGGEAAEQGPAGIFVRMIRPHMRDIPQVPFPKGFGIRPMRGDESALWTTVQRDSEEFITIADDLFAQEFGDDLPATQERCFFVVEEKRGGEDGGNRESESDEEGAAVGTISAWYSREIEGPGRGRIHWVAVRPAYRRRGLARAALSHAMARLAGWHERCWLATQTKRLPAIRLYLDFGFRPDLDAPGALAAWREVRAALDHPGLGDVG